MGQASGWEIYYRVLLAAGVSLLLPWGLWLVSRAIQRKAPPTGSDGERSPQGTRKHGGLFPAWTERPQAFVADELAQRLNTRFFLAANTALALVALVLTLVPSVVLLSASRRELVQSDGIKVLVLILALSVFLLVGLLYATRKGDLGWIRSFREDAES